MTTGVVQFSGPIVHEPLSARLPRPTLLWALIFLCLLQGLTVQAQLQVFNDNTYQTFSGVGVTNGRATNGTLYVSGIIGQPIIRSSTTLNELQAGILSAYSSGGFVFDNVAPAITPVDVLPDAFVQNVTPFSINVSDAVSVRGATIFARPLTSPAITNFDSLGLSTQSTSSTQKVFTQTIQKATWFDAMGMEYYFTATDGKGNKSRSPVSGLYYASLTKGVTLTNLPFSNHQSSYRIVSFPYDTLSNPYDPQKIYKLSTDVSKSRMYTYDASSKRFLEYANAEIRTLDRGRGYWLLFADEPSLPAHIVTSPTENRGNLFKITLKANSWNQIGNPYPVPIAWKDVLALDVNSAVDQNNLSKLNLFNGSYDSAGNKSLAPFEGGFIKNLGSADIDLYIPFLNQSMLGGKQSMPLGTDLSSDKWNVFLHVRNSNSETGNTLAGFGMHPKALLGPDRFDNYNPPHFLDLPEINFSRPQFPAIEFGNDVVTSQDDFQWTFSPRADNGETYEISWNSGILSNEQELLLFDPQQLTVLNMLTTDRFQFVKNESTQFKIYFGRDAAKKIAPDKITLVGPFPNPIQNAALHYTVAIPDIGVDASVAVQVYSSNGDPIHNSAGILQQGVQQLQIQLNPDQGPGMYIYKITIGQSPSMRSYTGKIIIP